VVEYPSVAQRDDRTRDSGTTRSTGGCPYAGRGWVDAGWVRKKSFLVETLSKLRFFGTS
jgi:hypothetical protein